MAVYRSLGMLLCNSCRDDATKGFRCLVQWHSSMWLRCETVEPLILRFVDNWSTNYYQIKLIFKLVKLQTFDLCFFKRSYNSAESQQAMILSNLPSLFSSWCDKVSISIFTAVKIWITFSHGDGRFFWLQQVDVNGALAHLYPITVAVEVLLNMFEKQSFTLLF